MIIALILTSWVGISVVFCLAIVGVAARRVPHRNDVVVAVRKRPAKRNRGFVLGTTEVQVPSPA